MLEIFKKNKTDKLLILKLLLWLLLHDINFTSIAAGAGQSSMRCESYFRQYKDHCQVLFIWSKSKFQKYAHEVLIVKQTWLCLSAGYIIKNAIIP